MAEVRIDPLTGLRAIIGTAEDWEPGQGAGGPLAGPTSGMPLGSPESLLSSASPETRAEANRDLFWAGPARGTHMVLEPPNDALGNLAISELDALLESWRVRMRELSESSCLHLAVEEHPDGRPIAELFALDFVPAAIARERERFGAHATRTMGGNLLGDLLQEEVRRRERVVAVDEDCVLIAPFASRAPYQLMVVPRRPRPRFEDDGPTGAGALGDALARLRRLLGGALPVSVWVRTAPSGAEHFCWRVDILPRLLEAGGLELGTGVPYNPLPPETAAARLREA